MDGRTYNLLLADDDEDDCTFFKESLDELPLSVTLKVVNDGVQLMSLLADTPPAHLPDIIFLDLNMPRKNGFECLTEIKLDEKLKRIPVIIFSTSLDMNVIDLLYEKGAVYYIRKPGVFSQLRKMIMSAINLGTLNNFRQPARNHFILQP